MSALYQADFFSAYGGDATAFVITKPLPAKIVAPRKPAAPKTEPVETHKRPTQAGRILAYLIAGHRLTALEALRLFGCLRLAARVHELRAEGHAIEEVMVHTAGGKKVAEYYMR